MAAEARAAAHHAEGMRLLEEGDPEDMPLEEALYHFERASELAPDVATYRQAARLLRQQVKLSERRSRWPLLDVVRARRRRCRDSAASRAPPRSQLDEDRQRAEQREKQNREAAAAFFSKACEAIHDDELELALRRMARAVELHPDGTAAAEGSSYREWYHVGALLALALVALDAAMSWLLLRRAI